MDWRTVPWVTVLYLLCFLDRINIGNARLKECSFLFFGVMARVFGEEFTPYLPEVVATLINSCGQDEGGEPGARE